MIRKLSSIFLITLCTATVSWAQIERAKVREGELAGVVNGGVSSFKGIPFAAPPVGDLRWKAPHPPKPWEGVRKAETFAAAPMQNGLLAAVMGGMGRRSEDCLYLNVWTPAKSVDEKLPVMVWIYGGGFMSGLTSSPMYDGAKLAQKGVVLVSIAYRVGPFGFLAHPDLSKESGKGSGCYGIQDQVAALRWVKENIAQFGGDPSRVTIFGESAGGISVSMLTVVPAAKGLFQRAISQSGGSMAPIKNDSEPGTQIPSLMKAEQTGRTFLGKLGVADIKAARALDADTVQKAMAGMGMGVFWPAADGETLTGDSYELYQASQFHDTPVLAGWNSDEGAMFVRSGATPEAFEKRMRNQSGPTAEVMLKAYPHATTAEALKASKDIVRDSVFAWPTWAWADLQTQKGKNKAWLYYFDHRGGSGSSGGGSMHAAEIPFVFGNLGGVLVSASEENKELSDLMRSYWVNFAKNGDPNGGGLPEWPAFDPKETKAMIFDKSPSARPLPNLEQIKAFDAYYEWRRKEAQTKAAN